jgi:GNAT superfamily N-acetyltransferase
MGSLGAFFFRAMTLTVRQGKKEDLPRVLELIKELAEYERAADEVINSTELMEGAGFGANPIFGFFVAEQNEFVVGISVYYYRYSTWKGKRLYLEDLMVTEAFRGKGIGKLLFERTMLKALEDDCSGMAWQVLNWNRPSIEFYKQFGAKLDGEWINCVMEIDEIRSRLKI